MVRRLQATTPFYHIFGGTQLQTLRCNACGKHSTQEEAFALITLPMLDGEGRTLDEMVLAHHSDEFIPDECQFDGCDAKDCRRRSYSVSSWPRVLVAHLKRWRYNADAGNFDKLDQHVSFGLEFRPEHSVNYALRGVVAHSGPAGFGHYTAFARGPTEAQWHFYNDSRKPRAATTADVLAAQAYLLVYERA